MHYLIIIFAFLCDIIGVKYGSIGHSLSGLSIKSQICESKKHAVRIEQELIDQYKAELNSRKAFGDKKQYVLDNKEHIAEYQCNYRLKHKKEMADYNSQYAQKNKEILDEYRKMYNLKNREKINERQKLNRLKKKQQLEQAEEIKE